ncbi:MAG: fluoride efflux transporter CrcB [bacterium]|nr:fluoride efflux transporter CrcB [bacterium]
MLRLIKELSIVGMGGFMGAILRYLVSGWAQTLSKSGFPFGTLAVNLIGSFVLGFVTGLSRHVIISPEIRMLVGIGMLGAFTTFSTFSYETMMLLREGAFLNAFLNIGVSLLAGLILVYLGYITGRAV